MGLALAYMWAGMGGDVDRIRNVGERDFERDVALIDEKSGEPYIKDIVVHPPQQTFEGAVNVLTYKRLAKDKQGRVGWLDARLIAKIPYKPAIAGQVKDDPALTIQKYLQELSATQNQVRFTYGWWMEPRTAMVLGTVAGIVVIGGIWPILLNLMIGAGFGRKSEPEPEPKKKESWWSQFRSRKPEPGSDLARPQPTADDKEHLRAVADAYEQNLQGAGVTMNTTAEADGAQESPTVRKLEGGPVEAAAPLKRPEDEDDIEVKGEFYPVLIHHHKKKDDPADGQAEKK